MTLICFLTHSTPSFSLLPRTTYLLVTLKLITLHIAPIHSLAVVISFMNPLISITCGRSISIYFFKNMFLSSKNLTWYSFWLTHIAVSIFQYTFQLNRTILNAQLLISTPTIISTPVTFPWLS